MVAPDSWVTDSTRVSPLTLAVAVAQPDLAFEKYILYNVIIYDNKNLYIFIFYITLSVRLPSEPETSQLILCSMNWYSPLAPMVDTFVMVLAPAEVVVY